MADEIDYKIIGDDMQAVIVTLDPGEMVLAEAGAMMYMQDGIVMNTTLDPNQQGGGMLVNVTIAFTKRIGAGFFGGEGFILQRIEGDGLAFLHALVRGPGRVVLQTLPFSRLADRILAAAPRQGGRRRDEGSVLGALGGLLDGDR